MYTFRRNTICKIWQNNTVVPYIKGVKVLISLFLLTFLILCITPGISNNVYATPSYGYTYTIGGTAYDYGNSITTDSSGNIYTTGFFLGTNINFNTTGSGSPDLKSSINGGLFVTKINANGSYGYTYTLNRAQGKGISTDTAGNVYLTGSFSSTNVNFNITGSGSPDLKSSIGGTDIFITKINANGSYGFTYTMGGTGDDIGYSITRDTAGNVYLTGSFSGTNVNFNTTGSGSPDLKSSIGGTDIFITKINANGSYGFTYTIGGTGDDTAYGITTDLLGNVYNTGGFSGANVNFNTTGSGSPDLKSSIGGTDIFITKINANASYGYTYTIGGTSDDSAYSITHDTSANVYLTGFFSGANVNFNTTGSGSPNLKSTNGGYDIFITKINANASYGYTYTIGGSNQEFGLGIDTDSLENIYITGGFGWFGGGTNVNFNTTGSGSPDLKTTIGDGNIFATKINANGSYGFTYIIGGGDSINDLSGGNGIKTDTLGNLYLTGFFEDSTGNGINFNPFGGTDIHHNANNNGSDDIFITKFSGVFDVPTATPTPTTTPSGGSSSSSSSGAGMSIPQAPVCSDEKPSSAPTIFQAEAGKNTVLLHINPAGSPYNKYYIAYGPSAGSETYGVEFNQDHSTGALTYDINVLAPNTVYYFKARAGNGCMTGDWSNNFKVKTTGYKGISKTYTTFNQPTDGSNKSNSFNGSLSNSISNEESTISSSPVPTQEKTISQTTAPSEATPPSTPQKHTSCFLWIFFCH